MRFYTGELIFVRYRETFKMNSHQHCNEGVIEDKKWFSFLAFWHPPTVNPSSFIINCTSRFPFIYNEMRRKNFTHAISLKSVEFFFFFQAIHFSTKFQKNRTPRLKANPRPFQIWHHYLRWMPQQQPKFRIFQVILSET